MIILKLGGSVISNKNKPFSFNKKVVSNIADEIAEFYPEENFIVVHGGGSFGHPLAKKYGIRGGLDSENKKIGFSKTHMAMIELNKKIVEIFIEHNLPAFPLAPSSIFFVENGEILEGFFEVIEKYLELKFIPVLFGDVAIAVDKGIDILSGDQIISSLSKIFMPEKVIFLMDVDGIYNKNPEEKEAKLIEEIKEPFEFNQKKGMYDVTGGIKNKVDQALKMNCTSYFINGRKKGYLRKAIIGEKVGTIIKK
ncbi:MAG TPA: isopentenyl phosphate kinase family protein [Thermoplasmatales archaeon]|nr:isopentenyl phosphate kinase family protein [Thermoplasmatales archaeon]